MGKVYWIPKPDPTGYTQYEEGAAGVYIFHQLSGLVYDPITWGPNEDNVSDGISHRVKFRALNARAGALKFTGCGFDLSGP